MTFRQISLSLLAAVALSACVAPAPDKIDSAQSSTDNFQKAKAAGIRSVAVGEFSAENSLTQQAQYLKDNLIVELQGAGLLDPGAASVVQGKLVDAQLGGTQGTVAARFTVTQSDGRVVYDRELRTSSQWTPNANAPKEHEAVYRKLVGVLFSDPGFRNAIPR
jgi:hypothetical protein